MEIGSKIFKEVDNQGNSIIIRAFINERGEYNFANVHLKLSSENRNRLLGKLDFTNRTLYVSRKMSKHYHRKSQSFGFNWKLIIDPYLAINKVHITVDDTQHYEIPSSIIREYGSFLNFKHQGFELQRFVKLSIIKMHNKLEDAAR